MTSVIDMLNQVLNRTGQETVSSLSALTNPARQALIFLNDVQKEMYFWLKSGWLFEQATLTTQANTFAYTLPDGLLPGQLLQESFSLEGSTRPLLLMELAKTHRLDKNIKAQPCYYWFQNNQLYLWPTPNKAYTIHFFYKPYPPELIDQTLELPQDWIYLMQLGTQAYLERFLGEPNASDLFALYYQNLANLKAKDKLQPNPRFKNGYRI